MRGSLVLLYTELHHHVGIEVMLTNNLSLSSMSDKAFEILVALLRGGVATSRPKVRNETECDAQGEVETNGRILQVREGFVTVNRVLYQSYFLRELEMLGLVDENGDLTPEARKLYSGLAEESDIAAKVFLNAKNERTPSSLPVRTAELSF